MDVVMIIPTGIGAEIGGHSGDATPAAKLIASVCDKLIVHPNVVNASDINEMTPNMLYVEGSILDKFLEGKTGLVETLGNKILLIVNQITPEIINAVSGARATIGANIEIVELIYPIKMVATMFNGIATGDLYNVDKAVNQLGNYNFDVLVVNTPIDTDPDKVTEYLTKDGGVNLWGGVEAKLSKAMSEKLHKPVIHAPVETSTLMRKFNEVVDPRKAAELVSVCYLHCCFKGAHVAPKMTTNINSPVTNSIWMYDIDFMISPMGIFGRPHIACRAAGIPIIYVEENKTILGSSVPKEGTMVVKNYLEVVGVIAAKKAGVSIESVRRPLAKTKVIKNIPEKV